ncbi:MAG: hypothetical protein ACON5K_09340 [Bacteroidia bacterium]
MNDLKFKSRFTGLIQVKDLHKLNSVSYTKDFNWFYLGLSDLQLLKDDFNIQENRVGAHWYREILDINKKKNNWFIPKDEIAIFTGKIHEVLLCEFLKNDRNQVNINQIDKDIYEVKGNCYFSIKQPKKTVPEILDSNSSHRTDGDGLNIININLESSNFDARIGQSKTNWFSGIGRKLFAKRKVDISTGSNFNNGIKNQSCFSGFFRRFFRILSWIWVFGLSFLWGATLFDLWSSDRTLFYGLLSIGLFWLFFRRLRWKWLSTITSVILFLALIGVYSEKNNLLPQKTKATKAGNIKESKPKKINRTDKDGNNIQDQTFQKKISWFDFISNNHVLNYQTFSSEYLNSKRSRITGISALQGYKDPVKYFNKIYINAVKEDQPKLDSIVSKIKIDVSRYNYKPIDIARTVVTMIQEIPYVLVHDKSCQEIISNNGDFVSTYHKEGKPCLPKIEGGVQTPYEFLHNLKGDCDTRSLLAHLILRKLGIKSSVWVSMDYGHSILGVALPVGSGSYKMINGVKHYGVELTAKGFDIGMVAPNQRQMANWDIALYN